jgi:hypothetical protein
MPKIYFYKDAQRRFSSCRFPDRGKPLATNIRLFNRSDGNFYVQVHGVTVFEITPDNKVTFTLSAEQAHSKGACLSIMLDRIIPFYWLRIAKGRYLIIDRKNLRELQEQRRAGKDDESWRSMLKARASEFYQGISFSLEEGKCLNPKYIGKPTINTDARLVWLRKLKAFKRAVSIRQKLGAFEPVAAEVRGNTSHLTSSTVLFSRVKDSINDEHVTVDLIKDIYIYIVSPWWRRSATSKDIESAVYRYLNNNSVDLRRSFGVFEKSGEANAE